MTAAEDPGRVALAQVGSATLAALDLVCVALRHVAAESGGRIEVIVREDGRVEINCEDGPYTRWTLRADVHPDLRPAEWPSGVIRGEVSP